MKLTFKDIIKEEVKVENVKNKIKKALPKESRLYSKINIHYIVLCIIINIIVFIISILLNIDSLLLISFLTCFIPSIILDSYLSNYKRKLAECNEKKLPKNILLYLLRNTRKIDFDTLSERFNELDIKERNVIDIMEEKNIYKNKNKKIKIEILKSKIKTCHVEELENNIELITEYVDTLNKNHQKEINKLIKQKRSENDIDLFKNKEIVKKEKKILAAKI